MLRGLIGHLNSAPRSISTTPNRSINMTDSGIPNAIEATGAAANKKSRFALHVEEKEDRGNWSSRVAFYMATIGAAVGFGNVWRFPSLCVDYGGGAFFVPYIMALFILGIPLAILEIGFGQYFQTGDIGVFGSFHPRLRGVGLASVACGFMLDTYYVVLNAWVCNAFFSSWRADAPWGTENLTGEDAVNYFIDEIIGERTAGDDQRPTRVVWRNVGFSAMCWVLIFLCVAWGVEWTGRISYFTMGLPIILLFVFLGKAVTLEGSDDGIEAYIGIWDMSVLTEQGEVWSVAASQIFFSIGLTFGILTAYGSHCKRDEPVVLNSCVIAFSNSMFSFISGFAVFAALGHLAFLQGGIPVTELPYAGFGLVFGTWPVVFNTLPGGIHWVRLILFNLFLLGIDSAFAFLEAFITVLHDTQYFEHVPRFWLALGMSLIGFVFSFIYCTDTGLIFLDTIDFYINFVMILVGFFEAFGSAWVYDILGQCERLSPAVVYSFLIANFGAVFLGCGLWFGVDNTDRTAVWAGFVGYILWYFAGLGVTFYFLKKRLDEDTDGKWTMSKLWYELYFGNIVALRNRMQQYIGPIPFVWCFLMKHILPHLLIILFINLAQTKTPDGVSLMGGFGGYPTTPYQVLGILTFAFTLFLFLLGLAFPNLYAPLALPQVKEAEMELSKYTGRDSQPLHNNDKLDVSPGDKTESKRGESVEVSEDHSEEQDA
ncbi:sodium:neurotransmitter symporter family protein [Nitzschia inconspicua]|uniref:Sodium:neurotransmitter symporter family protein n=1 Tax=Nitzschia inconspicua TaxID=303405 RepID=A0A9K3L4L5_9STRA|nr:sodium:neurotransmitter symporter family protein [Nitzschia inconspicua]